jgi:hypothetical protein
MVLRSYSHMLDFDYNSQRLKFPKPEGVVSPTRPGYREPSSPALALLSQLEEKRATFETRMRGSAMAITSQARESTHLHRSRKARSGVFPSAGGTERQEVPITRRLFHSRAGATSPPPAATTDASPGPPLEVSRCGAGRLPLEARPEPCGAPPMLWPFQEVYRDAINPRSCRRPDPCKTNPKDRSRACGPSAWGWWTR